MMKPILFNTEMVRAILDGRKTVTRRVVKPQHLKVLESQYHKEHPEMPDSVLLEKLCRSPYLSGDILYVREAWAEDPMINGYAYRAWFNTENGDAEKSDELFKWHPSIHMPKEAARLFLQVTDVQVERLQDITEEQAINEGCNGVFTGTGEAMGSGWDTTPCEEFSVLWNSTIKKADLPHYGWDANPWVWVIEFERCEKPKEDKL